MQNTTNFIETEPGVLIFYRDYGSGKPVILIHGWPSSNELWEYQIEALVAAGLRVIAYDRRGFGRSSQPWDGYDYNTLTNDLKTIIDSLALSEVTLVGFSMGGGEVARYFGNFNGKNIAKAVFVSAVTPFMLRTDDNPDGVPQEVFDNMSKQIADDRIGFLENFGRDFFGVGLLSKPLSAPLLDHFRWLCQIASPRATQQCAHAFATTDFRNDLSAVNVPTLIIHGDADKTVPIDASGNQTAKRLPHAQFLVYEGAPHGLFYTEKERLNRDLVNFINS